MTKLLGIAIAATALLTACSSNDDSDTNDKPSRTATADAQDAKSGADTGDLATTVETYINSLFNGHAADVYDTVSQRCVPAVGDRETFAESWEDAASYGDLKAGNVEATVDGDSGRASYTVGNRDSLTRTRQQWTMEDGAWRWDACPTTESGTPSPVSQDVTITQAGVEDHELWGAGTYVVHYEITNHGTADASYFAQLAFLDADGDQLGTTGITADNLGPGKTKAGETRPLEPEIENGPLGAVTSVQVTQVELT